MFVTADRSELPLATLVFNLDGFRSVNTAFGHDMGDTLLRETAERLRRECARQEFVGRISADFGDVDIVMRAENYRPLPDDWHVCLCDVRNSTAAIERGEYRSVNSLGVAAITAITLLALAYALRTAAALPPAAAATATHWSRRRWNRRRCSSIA